MISFDTFSGPCARVRESDLDAKGLLVLAEQSTPILKLFPPLFGASDTFYERQKDVKDSCDVFYMNKMAGQDQNHKIKHDQATGGRIRQIVQLLTLQSHNVGDARSALVAKLLRIVKVNELLLTRATEEQIANAANDAITDEILESVDQEERRRNGLTMQQQPMASTLFGPGPLSPFRVLELVDVLDSTTGGMVKRMLTKVRRRASNNTRMVKDNDIGREVEFCRFCSSYGDHTATQHRCRLCEVTGHHRSQSCPYREMAGSTTCNSDTNLPESSGASVDATDEDHSFCTLCNLWGNHATERHQCRKCGAHGVHRSQRCLSLATNLVSLSTDARQGQKFCTYCNAWRRHASDKHRCRLCGAVGLHRSDSCTQRSSSNIMLSYSVDAASKVRDRVLEKIPQVLPPSAVTLVWRSLDKVGDADLILRKTLQRIGVWGGGSQTPITTPYAPPSVNTSSDGAVTVSHENGVIDHDRPELLSSPRRATSVPSSCNPSVLRVPYEGQPNGVYVLSYAEGNSVVPARILKYMRLLMHHEVSTNAFSVVVRFDPRPSHWELMKPGMVSPRSLPSTPTLCHQLGKRMAHYTLQTLLGARNRLREREVAQRKYQHQVDHSQVKLQHRQTQEDVHYDQHQANAHETRQVVVPVDA
ncbi:unnamed protein product [Peronospora belbahrii]|uniref:CCHC-type domain-containing protein n=1 Tax=Peronospora belbahrii TaxID=622444 RepID=A0AAU9KM24_9STRA|nr:unnamed protein product [Peronospora belbahrii]CAH0515218.1 unnamed protein product [Peronospora belbahrii]